MLFHKNIRFINISVLHSDDILSYLTAMNYVLPTNIGNPLVRTKSILATRVSPPAYYKVIYCIRSFCDARSMQCVLLPKIDTLLTSLQY